jgi:glycine/D-amino acid oxidase-like deaminating enzyme
MSSRRAVVIGAGISGILVARELLLAGWDVTVVEAKHVGNGSSSRTAAGIRQQFTTRASVQGMRYSVGFYDRFAAETSDGRSPIVHNGYLFLYDTALAWSDAAARVDWQRSVGLDDVVALEGDALRERFPWVGEDMLGGTWCPSDGFLLPAVVYMEGARRVRELGGTVLQNAPVMGAEFSGDRITSVRTPKGELSADLFVDCTNAWTKRLAAHLGAVDLPVDPLKRYLWFLDRGGPMTAETLGRMPLVISPSGVYARPENEDVLLMGWKHHAEAEHQFTDEDQDTVEPGFSHDSGVDSRPFDAWMQFVEAVPDVGEFAGVRATTAGFYATTPDHNPYLGFDPQRSNLVRLVGFSGHGAMFGPFTAQVGLSLAEAGRDLKTVRLPDGTEVDITEFAIDRQPGTPEGMVL